MRVPSTSYSDTSRSGLLTWAGGRSSTALTRLKIVVFAPMTSASVKAAATVNPGEVARRRMA